MFQWWNAATSKLDENIRDKPIERHPDLWSTSVVDIFVLSQQLYPFSTFSSVLHTFTFAPDLHLPSARRPSLANPITLSKVARDTKRRRLEQGGSVQVDMLLRAADALEERDRGTTPAQAVGVGSALGIILQPRRALQLPFLECTPGRGKARGGSGGLGPRCFLVSQWH
eukprot:scaffold2751_cov266-Pinguiococcus_pyrenoidosus.AAC.8